VITALFAGILPAVQASGTAGADVLRAVSRGNSSARSTLRGALMVAQITLSVVLLVGAGLFVRSLWQAFDTDVGWKGCCSASW
jgi:putative ABC transport system permease protein